ncbi:MAG TPA: proline--tRNA ligase [archaeon]|nr:proline--tRNA ligase [archaeon]
MAEQEGITVKKSENFSEWYTQVVQKAELADMRYNVKGFLVHMPWSVRIMKLMYKYLEDELEKNGHEPIWFPAVIPESFLKKEREHAEFSAEVFWITEGGSKYEKLEERLALRPTSETAMYTMFSIWLRSWRDLPLKTYQNCQVWRYESFTRPFLRGREFYWIECHDVFATKEEAEKQVEEDMNTTENTLHKKYAIPFLFFRRPEHDKFKGAVYTFAADTVMPDGKAIQLPSTHFLGQNFSKVFNIKFVDKDKTEKYAWQTCYGPAVWRILGALAAIHGDDQGLVLPPAVAPLKAVIVPIFTKKDEDKVMEEALKIKNLLSKSCIDVKLDSRKELTPGWKYNYWEMKGVPIRIEIGPRDISKKQVVLVRRDNNEKIAVKEEKIVETVKKTLDDIQEKLIKKADGNFKNMINDAEDFDKLKNILEKKGGFVRANWCGSVECADNIKEKTGGGTIKGTLFNKNEKVFGNCVYCGKKAEKVVYFAKSY